MINNINYYIINYEGHDRLPHLNQIINYVTMLSTSFNNKTLNYFNLKI